MEVVAFQAAEAPPQAAKPLVGGGGQAGAPAAAGKAQAVPAQVQAQPVPVQIAPAPPVQVWMDSPMPHGRPMAPNGVVILTPGKGVPQLTSYAGAVRVRVSPILKKEGQPDQGALQFMLDAAAEPRLQGFRIIGAPTIEKALDDQGQSLAAAMAPMDPNGQDPAVGGGIAIGGRGVVVINGNVVINGMSTMPGMPGQKQQALVRLKPGEKQAKKLKELKGNLTAEVIIPNETLITVDNVMKAAGETVKGKNGGAITIQSIEKTGNGDYKVKINMETPPGGNNPFGGMFGGGAVMIQNVQIQVGGGGFGGGFPGSGPIQGSGLPELVDAKGNKLPLVQIPSRSMNVNNGQMTQEVVLVFRASKDQGEPVRMVLFGNRTTTVQVPFAFQNVPME